MFITILAFLFVLSILVFAHELGHFLAAKRAGVYVETFSLGMGPKVLKKTIGETEYCLSALPVGGYVKMKGENPDEPSTGAANELQSKSIAARFSIFVAGPMMNLVLAVLLVSFVYYIGIEEPKYLEEPPVIGWIEPDSPAQNIGLLPNDLLLAVGGTAVPNWEQAMLMIASTGDKSVNIDIRRGAETLTLQVTPELIKSLGAGVIGIHPIMKPVIGGLTPGFPAEKAGMRVGDLIVRINDTPIYHWLQMATLIHEHPEQELQIAILRDGQEILMRVTPQKDGKTGYLGIKSQEQTVLRKYGLAQSFSKGVARCWELTAMTFDMLRRLVTWQASTKSLGGPIMIAQLSGEAARQGAPDMINFIGVVSLSLGIFNLLPIPILDGGHIFLLFFELLNRKPLSMQRRELAQKIGLLILLPLIVFVFYNDIARLLGW